VSVIVPAYNAAETIGETLDSALAQTHVDLEVIVVNDGSTDGTIDVVRARARSDARIRLIEQENSGVAAARNRGIEAARGTFIAPLDADDIWVPSKVVRQVRRMEESGSRTGFVYSWWVWLDEQSRVLDASPRWRVEGNVRTKLLQVNFCGNASVPLIRREALETVGGYDVGMRESGAQGCEDWDILVRIAERYDAAVVPAALVGYRRRSTSMSAECDTMWRSWELLLKGVEQRQSGIDAALARQAADQFALHLAGISYWSGAYVQAVRWTLRAWRSGLSPRLMLNVFRLLTSRVLRRGSLKRQVTANDWIDHNVVPEALIPYDRIWEERWAEERERSAFGGS
jgi:glycosyltransferase involved in cell wall biosynthesis